MTDHPFEFHTARIPRLPTLDGESAFIAYIEIIEYGCEPREKLIGPFYAESPDALRDSLEARGDIVNRIEEA